MIRRFLHCCFLSYWHPGTGGGLGAWLDARVRTMDGLPVVPGRTLKGVLRDAVDRAERLGWQDDTAPDGRWADRLFGHPATAGGPSIPGLLRIGSAELDTATRSAVLALNDDEKQAVLRGMRAALHQTAIDQTGVAKEGSLRGIEVYVPMPLTAPIDWIGEDDEHAATAAFAMLARSLPLVEGLGAHRTRGLGRVALTLEDRP